ncbi:hypothetical protein BJX63DRAFT_432815 [Aspergillus granulosus]|uniref:Heterokaryon incompatibility domain-containing protein n=1 Tax=Aspergillus granulosus TaxID=176169 RepID=A0ABR4HBM7_9EURO
MDVKDQKPKRSFWQRLTSRFRSNPRNEPAHPPTSDLPAYSVHPPTELESANRGRTSYPQNQVADASISHPSNQLTEARTYNSPLPASAGTVSPVRGTDAQITEMFTEQDSYVIEYTNHSLWPLFKPNEGNLQWKCPNPILDFSTDPVRRQWAMGQSVGNRFGSQFFASRAPQRLPPRLFDLRANRVVETSTLRSLSIEYVFVSHVWGQNLVQLSGLTYGVDWDVPVLSVHKLEGIMTACRALCGVPYMWIDILCLDQRTHNETELLAMREYLENACGCLVWLDNTYKEPNWQRILESIEEVNKLYRLSKSGFPTHSMHEYGTNQGLFSIPLAPLQCFRLLRKLTRLEKAPWFKRLWTLQEGIIPAEALFVTPERYMIDRSALCKLSETFGFVAQYTIDQGMDSGVGLLQELQRSEIWKMVKLKQLYNMKQITYQHVFHATKTRECKLEQDKLFGVLGLIFGPTPPINYNRPIEDLYKEYYEMSVTSGDFSSMLFLGGSVWHTDDSMGVIFPSKPLPSLRSSSTPNHQLTVHRTINDAPGIKMENVGYDIVRAVHCLSAKGTLSYWQNRFPNYLLVDTHKASEIARAWGMPESSAILPNGGLGPGYLAATMGRTWDAEETIKKQYGADFQQQYKLLAAKAFVTWLRCHWLQTQLENTAVVVLWTERSAPQLAVITETLDGLEEGNVVIVTPREYVREAGQACLVCVKTGDGERVRKVGVGLGDSVRAGGAGSFVLCDS